MKKIIFSTILLTLFLIPTIAFANIGVGVGTGKIVIEDKLKPGVIYNLPDLTVLNTGDEPSDYEVGISYHEKQPELKPPEDWFIFSPRKFHLDPGKVQVVHIKLNLPLRIEPGDYFAYVEGHPVRKAVAGQSTIGVAAAAKLYFTVVPGSFFEGIYYKILSFWNVYAPWPQRITIGIIIIAVIIIFKKFFHIEINLRGSSRMPRSRLRDKDQTEKTG